MTSRRPDPDSAEARLARSCIRMLRRYARGADPESWAARHVIPALRRHAPLRPPVTVLQTGTLQWATMIAAVNIDKRNPDDVFAEMGLAVPDRLAAVDPGNPLAIGDIGPADLNLSPAAAEHADAIAEILSGPARPRLRHRLRARRKAGGPVWWQDAPETTAGAPEPDTSRLSALDKLAYRAMRPWTDDELSQAIAAKAKHLARRHCAPVDERSRIQAIALAELAGTTGGAWHGRLGDGWRVEDFVLCWRFAALLIMRQRHADWRQAPRFWRHQPWPASGDPKPGDRPYSQPWRAPPAIGETAAAGARANGHAARDGPLSPVPVGLLTRARRRLSRPSGPVYGPLAARIRAASSAWEQSRAALDAIGALSSPRDAAPPRSWAGIVAACHPHTGPPPFLAASGGHVMSP